MMVMTSQLRYALFTPMRKINNHLKVMWVHQIRCNVLNINISMKPNPHQAISNPLLE